MAYVSHDIFGGWVFENFSFVRDTVSDLTNSVMRHEYPLGVALLIASALLGVCFGLGVIARYSRRQNSRLFIVGVLLISIGFLNLLTSAVFPQDPMGAASTTAGVMHVVIVGICAVLAIAVLVLTASAAPRYWRGLMPFTVVTIILLLTGGAATGIVISQQLPLLGLVERLAIYPYLIWTAVFAGKLLADRSRH